MLLIRRLTAARCGFMSVDNKHRAQRFVRRCFSSKEMEWLLANDDFVTAFRAVEDLADAETTVIRGGRLLSAASQGDDGFRACHPVSDLRVPPPNASRGAALG